MLEFQTNKDIPGYITRDIHGKFRQGVVPYLMCLMAMMDSLQPPAIQTLISKQTQPKHDKLIKIHATLVETTNSNKKPIYNNKTLTVQSKFAPEYKPVSEDNLKRAFYQPMCKFLQSVNFYNTYTNTLINILFFFNHKNIHQMLSCLLSKRMC